MTNPPGDEPDQVGAPEGWQSPGGGPAYQQQPQQPPYGAYPPPYPPYGYFSPAVQNHPQAGLAMGLGLTGVIGLFLCCLPVVVSPFAWAIGQKSLREIRASGGRLGGEGQAQAGMIMGIIGTVLLVLAVLAVIAFAALAISTDPSGGTSL